jgi:hypothetical protein
MLKNLLELAVSIANLILFCIVIYLTINKDYLPSIVIMLQLIFFKLNKLSNEK